MKTYSLLPHENGFYFGDGTEKSVRIIFFSKQGGIDLLMDMFLRRKISAANVLELMRQVIALPYFPIVKRKIGDIDWLDQDYEELKKMKSMEHMLVQLEKLGRFHKPTVVLCANCGKHANILCSDFISDSFYSKEAGREIIEMMRDDELIDLAEELKLQKELKEIDLPETVSKRRNPTREN